MEDGRPNEAQDAELERMAEQFLASTPAPEPMAPIPLKFEATLDTRDIGIYLLAAVAVFGNMALAGFFHDRLAAGLTGLVSLLALLAIKVPKVAGPVWLACDLMLIASIISVAFRH